MGPGFESLKVQEVCGKTADSKLVRLTQRVHLFPFRTQKLSSVVPKILGWRRPGKIGIRQHETTEVRQGSNLSFVLGKICEDIPRVYQLIVRSGILNRVKIYLGICEANSQRLSTGSALRYS